MTEATHRRRIFDPTPYILVAPAMVLVAIVFAYPIVRIIVDSFQSPTAARGTKVDLSNYRFVLEDPVFWKSAGNNLFLLAGVPIMTALALLFAVVLFDRVRGWRVYRTLVFTPYILAVPVIGATFVYSTPTTGSSIPCCAASEPMPWPRTGSATRPWSRRRSSA